MQKHTKIYMKYFDYGIDDIILCENCLKVAVDIHHIDGRGKGKDVIENLMALCRNCHNKAGADKSFNKELKIIHMNKLKP